MKKFIKLLTIALVAAAPFAGSLKAVEARDSIGAETARINYNGFKKCKALGASGFKASAAGVSSNGGGGNNSSGFTTFRINTCFDTRAQCEKFIDRIDFHVTSIDYLYHASCFSRS